MRSPPRIVSLTAPKQGSSLEENEDFSHIEHPVGGRVFRAVLCDGATESIFAKEWSAMLAESAWFIALNGRVGRRNGSSPIDEWLGQLRSNFVQFSRPLALSWYAREKLSTTGASASFLGVNVTRGRGNCYWGGVSCGDTCVLHFRQSQLLSSFPISRPTDFHNRPMLVSSLPSASVPVFRRIDRQSWIPGDILIMATDALAAWIIDLPSTETRLSQLLDCSNCDQFSDLVSLERKAHRLKNDDSTAIILRL